jgi:hypothetical protein
LIKCNELKNLKAPIDFKYLLPKMKMNLKIGLPLRLLFVRLLQLKGILIILILELVGLLMDQFLQHLPSLALLPNVIKLKK